jgi:uncharacterized membrane protein
MPNVPSILEGSRNLSPAERAVSVVIGLGLAAAGAKPRPNPLLNVAALAGGAYLAFRGATGHCPVKQALHMGPIRLGAANEQRPQIRRSARAGRR